MPENVKIQLRRGTDDQWGSVDPVLSSGEPCFNTDTGAFKIGDEVSKFSELPDYRNGKFRSIVTVAKNDKFADFNCADAVYGGDDAACIQAALDYISNLGGGHLHITGGHYYCNSRLLYENNNLIMSGDGEKTILDFTAGESNLRCIAFTGGITGTYSLLTSER